VALALQVAEEHDDDNYWFLRSLKQESGKKVDRIALELHQEAFSIVDCMKCAKGSRTPRLIRSSLGQPLGWHWSMSSRIVKPHPSRWYAPFVYFDNKELRQQHYHDTPAAAAASFLLKTGSGQRRENLTRFLIADLIRSRAVGFGEEPVGAGVAEQHVDGRVVKDGL